MYSRMKKMGTITFDASNTYILIISNCAILKKKHCEVDIRCEVCITDGAISFDERMDKILNTSLLVFRSLEVKRPVRLKHTQIFSIENAEILMRSFAI